MNIVRTYAWVARAQCGCGYLWTTPGSPSVVCACGAAAIVDDVVVAGNPVTDDDAFTAAVTADLGLAVGGLALVQVS